jgi:hypothetical protein
MATGAAQPRIVPIVLVADLPEHGNMTDILSLVLEVPTTLSFPAAAIGIVPRPTPVLGKVVLVIGLYVGDNRIGVDEAAQSYYDAVRYSVLERYALDESGVASVRTGGQGITPVEFLNLLAGSLPAMRGPDPFDVLPA